MVVFPDRFCFQSCFLVSSSFAFTPTCPVNWTNLCISFSFLHFDFANNDWTYGERGTGWEIKCNESQRMIGRPRPKRMGEKKEKERGAGRNRHPDQQSSWSG